MIEEPPNFPLITAWFEGHRPTARWFPSSWVPIELHDHQVRFNDQKGMITCQKWEKPPSDRNRYQGPTDFRIHHIMVEEDSLAMLRSWEADPKNFPI